MRIIRKNRAGPCGRLAPLSSLRQPTARAATVPIHGSVRAISRRACGDGYDPQINYEFIEINRRIRKRHPEIIASVIQQIEAKGAVATWDKATELLRLNDELNVSIVLCRHITTTAGASRWVIRLDAGLKPDITIAVRMDATNEGIRDYYLLPGIDMTWENLRVAENNGIYLDAYRFDNLDYFFGMADRVKLQEAA